jgi:hypothetical protein
MKELYELKDMLLDKLKEYSKKGDLTSGTLDVVDKLSHAAKNVCKIIDDMENEGDYSRGYPYYDDYSYARGRGRMPRRDGMGRYSRAGSDMIHELRELMDDAPDDKTRQEFQRFIQKMEQM